MAQGKRVGLITQRSEDQNLFLIIKRRCPSWSKGVDLRSTVQCTHGFEPRSPHYHFCIIDNMTEWLR